MVHHSAASRSHLVRFRRGPGALIGHEVSLVDGCCRGDGWMDGWIDMDGVSAWLLIVS